MLGFLAFLLTSAGAFCFYQGSRIRSRCRQGPDGGTISLAAAVLLALGLGCWTLAIEPLMGSVAFATLLTAYWAPLPFIAMLRRRRSRAGGDRRGGAPTAAVIASASPRTLQP